jgi:ankyrin repeat protein
MRALLTQAWHSENGLLVNDPGVFGRPLHLAAASGNLTCVALLMQYGADIDARNCEGETALHIAARGNHSALVRQLVLNGAQLDIVATHSWTPLKVAAAHGHTEVVRILVQYDFGTQSSSLAR